MDNDLLEVAETVRLPTSEDLVQMSLSGKSRRPLLTACAIVAAIAAEDAGAIIRRPDRDDASYVTLGARFPAVGLLCADGVAAGTGTLIAPKWILTAAHVVDAGYSSAEEPGAKSTQKPQWTVLFGDREHHVQNIVEYPGRTRRGSRIDLALVELSAPVRSIAPIPLFLGTNELGATIIVVGFGAPGTFETGPLADAAAVEFAALPPRLRVKRAGTNVVVATTDDSLETLIERLGSATDLEGQVAGGDSGGPALIESDGRVLIAGVTAGVGSPAPENSPAVYGEGASFVRVSTFARWIEDVTGEDLGVVRPERRWLLVGLLLLLAIPLVVWSRRSTVR